jgi:hypothetical protein
MGPVARKTGIGDWGLGNWELKATCRAALLFRGA